MLDEVYATPQPGDVSTTRWRLEACAGLVASAPALTGGARRGSSRRHPRCHRHSATGAIGLGTQKADGRCSRLPAAAQ